MEEALKHASDDENYEGESGIKIRVRIPAEFEVDYIIKVNDPDNVDEIQERMLKFDASRWEQDPNSMDVSERAGTILSGRSQKNISRR